MSGSFRFLLGTHMPNWLWDERVSGPLFVSQRRLSRQRSYHPAVVPWALDSGGFSELSLFGEWQTSPKTYIKAVRRYEREIGQLLWVAPQDWMCEPVILKKTGLSLAEHQRRTVKSFLRLSDAGVPVIPVIQGWVESDYLHCVDLYEKAGVSLRYEPLVGLGSVCRRQGTGEIAHLVKRMASEHLAIHGFGMKVAGLRLSAGLLRSADSLSWSYQARLRPPLPGCSHQKCQNCLLYAEKWRSYVLQMATPMRPGKHTSPSSSIQTSRRVESRGLGVEMTRPR